jgi:peptidoglycan/LPS O-acetylase OafA/YrhL
LRAPSPGSALPQLTFTRYVAALAVVTFHYAAFHVGHGLRWLDDGRWLTFVTQWPVAVTFFFVLSGFVLATAYPTLDGADARRRFWRARFARIYPVYLLALVLTVALQSRADSVSASAVLGQASLLQGFVPAWIGTLNYPGWSLSAEAFFYTLFPWLIGWMSVRRSAKALLLAVAALWVVTQLVYMALLGLDAAGALSPAAGIFARFNPPLYLSSFLWGIAAALLLRKHARGCDARPWIARRGAMLAAVASIAGVAAGLAILPGWSQASAWHVVTDHCLFAPLFATAIAALALDRSRLARALSWRPLVILGEASYAVYILQVPAWIVFDAWVRPMLAIGPTGGYVVFVALLTALSVLVLYAVEKPARAWLRPAGGARSAALALTSS